jgi:hypothetical protein
VLHLAASTALYGLCAVIQVLPLNGSSLLSVPDDLACEHILYRGPSVCPACFLWAFPQLLHLLYLLSVLTNPLMLSLLCLACIYCLACKLFCCVTMCALASASLPRTAESGSCTSVAGRVAMAMLSVGSIAGRCWWACWMHVGAAWGTTVVAGRPQSQSQGCAGMSGSAPVHARYRLSQGQVGTQACQQTWQACRQH